MRVLIALDGSEVGEAALRSVAPWAREAGAVVFLLTVLHPRNVHETFSTEGTSHALTPEGTPAGQLLSVSEPLPRSAEDRSQALARVRAAAENYLNQMSVRYLAGVQTSMHVEWSESTATAIADFARTFKVDFIGMGTHGRTGLSHALMGSVAETVVRKASVPVLMVRSGVDAGAHVPQAAGELVAAAPNSKAEG